MMAIRFISLVEEKIFVGETGAFDGALGVSYGYLPVLKVFPPRSLAPN